jgi:hypothetical protein
VYFIDRDKAESLKLAYACNKELKKRGQGGKERERERERTSTRERTRTRLD